MKTQLGKRVELAGDFPCVRTKGISIPEATSNTKDRQVFLKCSLSNYFRLAPNSVAIKVRSLTLCCRTSITSCFFAKLHPGRDQTRRSFTGLISDMARWPSLLSKKCWSWAAMGEQAHFLTGILPLKDSSNKDKSEPRRYSFNTYKSRCHKTQPTFHQKSQWGNSNISVSTHKPVWLLMKILLVFHN